MLDVFNQVCMTDFLKFSVLYGGALVLILNLYIWANVLIQVRMYGIKRVLAVLSAWPAKCARSM